jgi:hypothetical protein
MCMACSLERMSCELIVMSCLVNVRSLSQHTQPSEARHQHDSDAHEMFPAVRRSWLIVRLILLISLGLCLPLKQM